MPADVSSILADLRLVAAERERRAASVDLMARVQAIKHYQQRRFSHTYADLLAAPRYAAVARFFLDELYGPHDFTERDAQLARIVPALVRLFPQAMVDAVGTLVQLHALSEVLDSRMGSNLDGVDVDASRYIEAWCATGMVESRERQIALTLEVGTALDALTGKPLLRNSLRLMRRPAHAAGLGALQTFLEAGFDTFKAMGGAQEFLSLIESREHRLADALFAAGDRVDAGARDDALGQLP